MATGTPKILGLFSSNLSILLNGTVSDILRGATFGSLGGLIGKSICGYLIYCFGYSAVMVGAFILSLCCLAIEFLNIISINITSFYFIAMLQGFLAGIIYSAILAYLGDSFSGDIYKKYIAIITCGLGLAGPLFGVLSLVFDFKGLVRIILLFALAGAVFSLLTFSNKKKMEKKNDTVVQMDIKSKKSISVFNGFSLLFKQKSIFLFAFSFATSMFGSLLVFFNTKRLFILLLGSSSIMSIHSPLAKLIMVIPMLGGGLFFFIKKTEKNFILISLTMLSLIVVYFFINSIYLCFLILMMAYGLQLILIPAGSDLFTSHQQSHKAYYSYIIHTIRSLYTIMLNELQSRYFIVNFRSLILVVFILNTLSLVFFLLGRKVLNRQSKEN